MASAIPRAIGLCVGLASWGCTRGPDLDLDFGDRTTACGLLVSHDDRDVFTATVLDLREDQIHPTDFRLDIDPAAQVTWLVSSSSASALQLEPGALEFAWAGREMPHFEEISSAAAGESLARLDALPPAISAMRISESESLGCGRAEVHQINLPSRAAESRVLRMGTQVLVVTSLSEAFLLDAQLQLKGPLKAASSWLTYRGASSVGDEVWATRWSCMTRVHASDVAIEHRPTRLCAEAEIVSGVSFDARQFIVKTTTGELRLIAEDTVPVIAFGVISPERPVAGPNGRYWLLGTQVDFIITVSPDGTTTREPVPILAEFITALDYIPGFGLLAGDSGGNVFQRGEDGRWTHLGDPGLFYGASAFAAFRDGFVVSGGTTEGARYIPGHGFCELASLSSGGGATSIAPLGKGLVFASYKHPHSQTLAITWVRFVD